MTREQSTLLDFLEGKGEDIYGRTLQSILEIPGRWWFEVTHNYIQWLFPLREESNAAYSVPLTDEMVDYIKKNDEILRNIKRSFLKMLEFYGFVCKDNGIVPVIGRTEMIVKWLNLRNHNFLRITRILGCLSIVGYGDLAKEWLDALEEETKDLHYVEKSKEFWREAVTWV